MLCLEACPTGALVEPAVLDSTRCISYLTIELRGPIAEPLEAGVGTHVYGCDICQEVCPWNAMAPTSDDAAWQPRPAWDMRTVAQLSQMSDDDIRSAVRGSAMRRTRMEGLRRNIAVAIHNGEAKQAERLGR
jgi:epoxyqueuosine reductase